MDYLYHVEDPLTSPVNWPARQAAIPGMRSATAVVLAAPDVASSSTAFTPRITRYVRSPVVIPIYPVLSYRTHEVESGLTAYIDGTAVHLLSRERPRDDAVWQFVRRLYDDPATITA